ncbi:hypothetical protein J6590_054558 [Homalodisca vitripennis]|nr:hypothetical protein J6590_054558 [Homalodisca vitripennis]
MALHFEAISSPNDCCKYIRRGRGWFTNYSHIEMSSSLVPELVVGTFNSISPELRQRRGRGRFTYCDVQFVSPGTRCRDIQFDCEIDGQSCSHQNFGRDEGAAGSHIEMFSSLVPELVVETFNSIVRSTVNHVVTRTSTEKRARSPELRQRRGRGWFTNYSHIEMSSSLVPELVVETFNSIVRSTVNHVVTRTSAEKRARAVHILRCPVR